MKRSLFLLVFITTFILLLYMVGSTVVNFIMSLMPMSAQEWFPLIKFLIWVFTFTFDPIDKVGEKWNSENFAYISNDDPNTLIIREGNNLEQKCKKVFTPKERKLEEKNLSNDLKPMST